MTGNVSDFYVNAVTAVTSTIAKLVLNCRPAISAGNNKSLSFGLSIVRWWLRLQYMQPRFQRWESENR